jgi:hypothetical protein
MSAWDGVTNKSHCFDVTLTLLGTRAVSRAFFDGTPDGLLMMGAYIDPHVLHTSSGSVLYERERQAGGQLVAVRPFVFVGKRGRRRAASGKSQIRCVRSWP